MRPLRIGRRPVPVLMALSLVTACEGGDGFAMEEYAPEAESASIEAVSLGTSDTQQFDPARTGTEFPSGTRKVMVWFRFADAEGKRVGIRWSHEGEVVLEQGEPFDALSGTNVWYLEMSAGSPLPDGSYQVELSEDGEVVSTIPFTIGGDAAEE